jgi:hypothetical protein
MTPSARGHCGRILCWLFRHGLLSPEPGQVFYDDRAPDYFQESFSLETTQIAGHEFPYRPQFRRQILVGGGQLHSDALFCRGSASLG